MSLVGTAKTFVVLATEVIAQKIAPLAADFTPITALIMSLFGLMILIGILKKFERI